jgi:hypothetical protein
VGEVNRKRKGKMEKGTNRWTEVTEERRFNEGDTNKQDELFEII